MVVVVVEQTPILEISQRTKQRALLPAITIVLASPFAPISLTLFSPSIVQIAQFANLIIGKRMEATERSALKLDDLIWQHRSSEGDGGGGRAHRSNNRTRAETRILLSGKRRANRKNSLFLFRPSNCLTYSSSSSTSLSLSLIVFARSMAFTLSQTS